MPVNHPIAVILLSGGLDSTTVLAIAKQKGCECHCISFDYGQRHRAELTAAARLADLYNVAEHRVIRFDLAQFGCSALTDAKLAVPEAGSVQTHGIPITYVPARNTVMLSMALAWAETLDAQMIFAGVNAVDYSGYPDCRPEYIAAFERMANLATRAGVEGRHLSICAPLIDCSKADIIRWGTELGVDYALTVSCYQADEEGRACGVCDACHLRHQGFVQAGISDPTRYRC